MTMAGRGFRECQGIEIAGLNDLAPWLHQMSNGRYVLTNKGPLSEFLQREVGDVIMNTRNGNVWTLEVKCEVTYTGNFYLETWSNLDFVYRTPGWMKTLKTDALCYYFQDRKVFYTIPFRRLWKWAFGEKGPNGRLIPGNIRRFPERDQNKTKQLNFTIGACVPISVIERAMKIRRYSVGANSVVEMTEAELLPMESQ